MTRSPARACVLCATLAAASSTAHSQELVENGGFETGGFAPWLAPPFVPLGQPDPQYFIVGSGGGHTGARFAVMSSTQLRFVSQVLPTSGGGSDYELSFWLRRTSTAPAGFIVRWEGQSVFAQSLQFQPPFDWRYFTLPLHSNIHGSLLAFGQMDFPGEFHIDDISVVQVPAPSAAALLGITGLLALSRRPRRGAP